MSCSGANPRIRARHNALGIEPSPLRRDASSGRIHHVKKGAGTDDRHLIQAELESHILDVTPLKPPISCLYVEQHEILVWPVISAAFLDLGPIAFAVKTGAIEEEVGLEMLVAELSSRGA